MPFLLFMGGISAFIVGIIWLDYRSLGRHKMDDAKAERFAAAALARWKVSGDAMARAQVTERRARLARVKTRFWQNLKLALWLDAAVATLFSLFPILAHFQGTTIDAKYLLALVEGIFFFGGMFTVIIMGATFILAFDFIGWRTLKTFVGIYDRRECEISIAKDGILYRPGGFQQYNYVIWRVEVIPGDVSILAIRTEGPPTPKGRRAQDFFVPIPPGLEAEGQALAERMMRGY